MCILLSHSRSDDFSNVVRTRHHRKGVCSNVQQQVSQRRNHIHPCPQRLQRDLARPLQKPLFSLERLPQKVDQSKRNRLYLRALDEHLLQRRLVLRAWQLLRAQQRRRKLRVREHVDKQLPHERARLRLEDGEVDGLEDGERAAVLREPPAERARDVAHARGGDGLDVEARAGVLAEALEDLGAADGRLAEVAEEVPEAELERDLVRVREAAELLADEGVVRVVLLFRYKACQL